VGGSIIFHKESPFQKLERVSINYIFVKRIMEKSGDQMSPIHSRSLIDFDISESAVKFIIDNRDIPSLVDTSDVDGSSQHSNSSSVASSGDQIRSSISLTTSQMNTIKSEIIENQNVSQDICDEKAVAPTPFNDFQHILENVEADETIDDVVKNDDADTSIQIDVSNDTVKTSNLIDDDQSTENITNDLIEISSVTSQPKKELQLETETTDDSSECGTIFSNSISYVTDFFSCSAPCMNNQVDTNNEVDDRNDNSTNADADPEIESQLERLQLCIELDILTLMGCSAEGAHNLINSLGQSTFCYRCQCYKTKSPSKENGSRNMTCQCSSSQEVSNRPKLRNRNVYVRQKAAKRVRQLREGGLSRRFTMTPLYTFLEEEMDVVREEDNGRSILSEDDEGAEITRRAGKVLIPRCKRPKSLSQESTRQTSLSSPSTSFEPTILATRSQDIDSGKGSLNHNTEPCSKSVFFGFFQKSHNDQSTKNDSDEASYDLYYDSDPGTHDGSDKMNPNELRKIISVKGRRNRTIGGCNNIGSDLHNFEIYFLPKQISLLQSLDVHNFDINDSVLVSQLIKELTSGSFSFIWHPKKSIEKKSGFSNSPPDLIKAWFEMGSCLKKTLLQPKFVWRTNRSLLHASKRAKVRSIKAPEYVELLNIVRIIVPSEVDRRVHPFVNKDCVFIIVTSSDDESVFEAATRMERDKFVFALKIIVARLASKIIVGDKDVFDEFFTPLGIKKRRKKYRKKKSSSMVVSMNSLEEDFDGSDDTSRQQSSESDSGLCKLLVKSVEEESQRKSELWG